MELGVAVTTFVPLVGIGLIVYEHAIPPWTPLRTIGLFLLLAATVALTIARLQLGNSFSVSPQAKKLVTHGIYSRIRNPIYVFGTLVFAGLVLFIGQPYLFLLLIPVLILQFTRARAESRVLEAHFGEDYRHYKASTWF
jgi:protein-S-isoprenylcysteine O-methyltransferase Ste14